MSKTSSIEKNRRKRMVLRFTEKRKALKEIIMNKNISLDERFQAQLKIAKLPRNSAPSRVRNRCELSGRARGYHREVKLSRIWFRALASTAQLPGFRKASW